MISQDIGRTRVKAPQKYLYEYRTDEHKTSFIASKDTKKLLQAFFVDEFRKMTDFKIPALTKDDDQFDEFGADPNIPLLPYSDDIIRKTGCEWVVFPAAIVLLRRLAKHMPDMKLSINNMHRIMLSCLMIADKTVEDIPACNESFADGGHFSAELVQSIEMEFLAKIDYDSYISREEVTEILNEWGFDLPSDEKA